jgi:hypothetical protein
MLYSFQNVSSDYPNNDMHSFNATSSIVTELQAFE